MTKNITEPNYQPAPTPHPCGNWSTVNCNLLAHGYNGFFFSDPHEEDVYNNNTLPCSPDDCNTGLDHKPLSTQTYLIISGGVATVLILLAVYRSWNSSRVGYTRLSEVSLQNHNKLLTSGTIIDRYPVIDTQPDYTQLSGNQLRDEDTTSARSSPRATIIKTSTNFFLSRGGDSSDEESSSENSSPERRITQSGM